MQGLYYTIMLWHKIQKYKISIDENYDEKGMKYYTEVSLKPVPDDHLFCSAIAVAKRNEEH